LVSLINRRTRTKWDTYLNWLFGLLFVVMAVSLIFPAIEIFTPSPVLTFILAGAGIFKGLKAREREHYPPLPIEFYQRENFLGGVNLNYNIDGIEWIPSSGERAFFSRSAIEDIDETDQTLVLFLGKRSGIVIAKSAFANEKKYREFLQYVALGTE